MFDNEIDWVNTYKAEQQLCLYAGTPEVQEALFWLSVFRICGHAGLVPSADRRRITHRMQLLCLHGVNSMVKLLRAHGGCLGRNRR